MCRSWFYKVVNAPPQISRLIESGHGRHAVQIANEYSYKLGQKIKLNFGANLAGFCMDSHI